jgi:hypothetical protein
MSSLSMRILAIGLIFIGESLAIYIEINGAKAFSTNSVFFQTFIKGAIFLFIAGCALLVGYMFGYRGFKNIWIVSAISITSILIIEPVINYLIFHQLPTKGAFVGLILGVMGFVAALFL